MSYDTPFDTVKLHELTYLLTTWQFGATVLYHV
jgi:hypothetical protein